MHRPTSSYPFDRLSWLLFKGLLRKLLMQFLLLWFPRYNCLRNLHFVIINNKQICMTEYKEGEVIVVTPCHHVFHKCCCQEWFQLARTCPVCRTDVPEALSNPNGFIVDSGDRMENIRNPQNMSFSISSLLHGQRQSARDVSDRPEERVIELSGTTINPDRGDDQTNYHAGIPRVDVYWASV